MKSLRDLLQRLLTWLAAALSARRRERAPRPAHGPAHPWHYAHLRVRLLPRALAPAPAPAPRPMQAPPPAHILALLASAPEVEPEFARRRRIALAPLRAAATRLRIYNPVRAPAAAAPAARPAVPLHARVTRAFGGLRDWLIFDTAPPQPG